MSHFPIFYQLVSHECLFFSQICVSSECERSGFIRVASGKRRGFVPCDVLEIIWGEHSEMHRRGQSEGIDPPPEGLRRRILNPQNGHEKPTTAFASPEKLGVFLDLSGMLDVLVGIPFRCRSEVPRRPSCLSFAGRREISLPLDLLSFIEPVLVFSPPPWLSLLWAVYFPKAKPPSEAKENETHTYYS